MRRVLIAIGCLLCFVSVVRAAEVRSASGVALSESFNAMYAGSDATGSHVIGLWQFDGEQRLQDASGNGHTLQLRGAKLSDEGRFGGALESFRGWQASDAPHHAVAKNSRALTPKGAFTIELWIKAKPDLAGYAEAFLLDKKYADNTDYQLTLSAAGKSGQRRLIARLGFGEDSEQYDSQSFRCEAGVWHHIAFAYDGNGTGRFFVDGAAMGSSAVAGRAAVAPGKQNLVIGDRVGSYHHGFPGYIDQARICNGALEFSPASLEQVSLRKVFVRMEKPAALAFAVTNRLRTPLKGATAQFTLSGSPPKRAALPELQPGARHTLQYNLDTSLRPDQYHLIATLEIPGEKPVRSSEEFIVTIVPRQLPQHMPVVMWGASLGEVDRLKDLGFTHCIGIHADMGRIWEAGRPTDATSPERLPEVVAGLDYAL
ncbi:LamG domain-containing protein, partial [Candidatus Sumerlaeota bacterium]|nr:LamG domain-containing protein [Candidatus Sumerlaeota bacterium]